MMKIRELRLRHFRNVGETLRTISFADEATGLVRSLTVLVGSNGFASLTPPTRASTAARDTYPTHPAAP